MARVAVAITCLLTPVGLSSGVASAPGASLSKCLPSPVLLSSTVFRDIRGRTQTGSVWALVFEPPPLLKPHRAEFAYRRQVKIAWHVTGRGRLRLAARGPNRSSAKLVSGPDRHQASNWNRPGCEWRTVFSFPRLGCWLIEARTNTTHVVVTFPLRRRP